MKPLILDIGCGHDFKGNVNIDLFVEPTRHRIIGLPNYKAPDFKLDGIPNLIKADCCHLPIRDDVVDVALSFHLIEHIDNPTGLLREMRRVVRDKGKIVVETPHKLSHRRHWDVHKHSFNLTWFAQVFKKLNIKIVKTTKSYRSYPHEYFPLIRLPYFIRIVGRVEK